MKIPIFSVNAFRQIDFKLLFKRVGIPVHLFLISLVLLVRVEPYFWDTIQFGSLHPEWFIQTNFSSFILPDQIDSGHPPTFGLYIAIMWKLLGKSLITSHLAMLPFLFIFTYYAQKIALLFFNDGMVVWMIAILVLDTTFLAQATLISPDVPLCAFFLMALYGIWNRKSIPKLLGAFGLALISLRGISILGGLIMYECWLIYYYSDNRSLNTIWGRLKDFSLGVFFALTFLIIHYLTKGWIGYHDSSPWAPSFAFTNLDGFIKNVGVMLWRMIDFGHIFILAPVLWIISNIQNSPNFRKIKQISGLLFFMFLILVPQLFYEGLLAHRYFLPFYLTMSILCLYGLSLFIKNRTWASIIAMICLLGMLSGNLWRYPRHIAQGWDSSLTYLPYNGLMKEAKTYIDNLQIPRSLIGTAFPNLRSEYFTHLNQNRELFKPKDLGRDQYILYSNVMNEFSDSEIEQLFLQWDALKVWRKGNVEVILFKR